MNTFANTLALMNKNSDKQRNRGKERTILNRIAYGTMYIPYDRFEL